MSFKRFECEVSLDLEIKKNHIYIAITVLISHTRYKYTRITFEVTGTGADSINSTELTEYINAELGLNTSYTYTAMMTEVNHKSP